MHAFTVALVADPEAPFERTADEEEWSRTWGSRRKAEVHAEAHDTLATILERAASQLGVGPPDGHQPATFSAAYLRIAFWQPEHDSRGITTNRSEMSELHLLDREGRLVFGVHDLRTVTAAQLLRTAEAGALEGDPLRPYLIVEAGYGDAPPVDWPTFKAALDVAYDVIQVVANVGGAAVALKLSFDAIRKRIRRG